MSPLAKPLVIWMAHTSFQKNRGDRAAFKQHMIPDISVMFSLTPTKQLALADHSPCKCGIVQNLILHSKPEKNFAENGV